MADFSPITSERLPIISGTTAPPTIPVQRIPANVPWLVEMEFSPSDITIDHITEAKKPQTGNAITAASALPTKAIVRLIIAPAVNTINILRLSKSFNSSNPSRQPNVIKPQNQATAVAPVVSGLFP